MDLIGSTVKSRPGSTLGNRIFAAEYLTIGFPFLAEFLFSKLKEYEVKKYNLIVVLGGVLIFTVYIFLLRSRTAYLICTLIVLVYLFLFFFRNQGIRIRRKIIIGVLGVVIILISFYISESNLFKSDPERNSFSKTVNLIFDYDYNSLRLRYWRTSIDMFREEPLSGVGTGMWFGNYMKYKQLIWYDGVKKYNSYEISDKGINNNSDINPHNVYLEILSENGIIGLILFLAIFVYPLFNLFRLLKRDVIYLPYFLSLLSFLIFAFFSFTKDNICVMILVFMSIALSSRIDALHYSADKKSFKFSVKIYLYIILLPIIALLIFNFLRLLSEKRYISALNYKAKVDYINMDIELNKISDVIYPVDVNCMPLDFYRGVGYYERREFSKSLEFFRKAAIEVPNMAIITSNLASAYYQTGEIDSAKMLFNDLKQKCPLFIEPQINLLSVYTNTRNYDSAKILMKEIEGNKFDTNTVKNYLIFKQIKEYLK
ncbi:MAG TPA: O-antigen ligase family protein [Ignavibacteria bacterium]